MKRNVTIIELGDIFEDNEDKKKFIVLSNDILVTNQDLNFVCLYYEKGYAAPHTKSYILSDNFTFVGNDYELAKKILNTGRE